MRLQIQIFMEGDYRVQNDYSLNLGKNLYLGHFNHLTPLQDLWKIPFLKNKLGQKFLKSGKNFDNFFSLKCQLLTDQIPNAEC